MWTKSESLLRTVSLCSLSLNPNFEKNSELQLCLQVKQFEFVGFLILFKIVNLAQEETLGIRKGLMLSADNSSSKNL